MAKTTTATTTSGPVYKPGKQTSEFWVFRAIETLQIVGGVLGMIPWDLVAGLLTGSAVSYGGLRTLAKRG